MTSHGRHAVHQASSESKLDHCYVQYAFSGEDTEDWARRPARLSDEHVHLHSVIQNNYAKAMGIRGGIYCYQSTVTIDGNRILNNHSGYSGGGADLLQRVDGPNKG